MNLAHCIIAANVAVILVVGVATLFLPYVDEPILPTTILFGVVWVGVLTACIVWGHTPSQRR